MEADDHDSGTITPAVLPDRTAITPTVYLGNSPGKNERPKPLLDFYNVDPVRPKSSAAARLYIYPPLVGGLSAADAATNDSEKDRHQHKITQEKHLGPMLKWREIAQGDVRHGVE